MSDFDLHRTCALSTAMTAKAFFPEHFERPFCGLHKDLFNFLDDPSKKRVVIAAPRGFGKTTSVMVGYLGRVILYGLYDVIVLLSASKEHSQDQLKTISTETAVADKVQGEFGDLSGDTWNLDYKEFKSGTHVIARGAGQQIRGKKIGKHRPSLIILDDVETRDLVKNKDRLKEFKKWFYTDVMRAGVNTGKDCKIVFIGTVLSEDSLLSELLKDPRWEGVRLEAFDDKYEPTYPEFLNKKEVMDLVDEYTEKGMLDELFQEYRNLSMAATNAIFKRFHYYEEGDALHEVIWRDIYRRRNPSFVIVDPAREINANNDFSAIIGACVDLQMGSAFIDMTYNERVLPEVLIEQAFDMADMMRTPVVYIEETGRHQWLTTVVRSLMFKRGKLYDVRPLKAIGAKESRIKMLAPMSNSGMVHYKRSACATLIGQLQVFPKGANDDLADCAAYITAVLQDTQGWSYLSMDYSELEEQRRLGAARLVGQSKSSGDDLLELSDVLYC